MELSNFCKSSPNDANDCLVFVANPTYQDYIHRLVLFKSRTCIFVTGDCQRVHGEFFGSWKIKKNKLVIHYTYDITLKEKCDIKKSMHKSIIVD